jgi:hypothetical protein
MSFVHVSPQFGHIVNTRECKYGELDVLLVFEELLADRWLVIYRRRNGEMEIMSRYILFESWEQMDYQPYTPIVAVGISLDKDNCHIVIEQNTQQRSVKIFEKRSNGKVEIRELLMCPMCASREEIQGAEAIDARGASSALRRLFPNHGEVLDKRMVATVYGRKAYVLEQVELQRWLDVYVWVDATWSLQLVYQSAEQEEFGICSLRAPVVGVFAHKTSFSCRVFVVEESALLRWWHSYNWDGVALKHSTSSEVLLSKVAVLYAERVLGVGEEARNEVVYHPPAVGRTQRVEKSGDHEGGRERLDVIDLTGED